MIEQAVSFGRGGNLQGVVSEPDASTRSGAPDVLVLNTGSTHKVGAFRMTVDLARALTRVGVRVLRFDLSGLGDSRMRAAREHEEDIALSDVRDAMDFLGERYRSRRFVLMGLCSGSDNSHRAAVADERVVGAVHLEGIGYRTLRYYGIYYGPRFLSKDFIARQLERKILGAGDDAAPANAYERKFPPKEQVARDLTALMARGVRLLYIYNHGAHLHTNYREQLRESFPSVDFGDRLEVEMYPLAGHTYPLVRGRATAVGRIVEWTERNFAA
jgi:hypothetical protein